ncbi:MAG: peptidoglycan DD-metalloendopeptidase family protein [Clostridia bacterium]|nr:peptidoglycan DD-metalloendopeptidase family protein [Clostridia bacterium]
MQKRTDENNNKTSVTTVMTDCFNTIKNINARVLSAVLCAVMLIASLGFVTKYYTLGYDVYYGDVNVGVISSKQEALDAYTEAATDVAEHNRGDLDFDLRFVMTIASVDEMTDSDIYRGIVEAAGGKEVCYSIEAGGVSVAKLKTKSDAQKAVETYVASFNREDAEIFTSYSIVNAKGIVTELVSVDEAVQLIEDSNLFVVVYKDVVEEEVEIPFAKTIVEDDTIPQGVTMCTQQGVNGRGIKKEITFYENGVKKHNIDPVVTVTVEPVEEITVLGTGEMSGLDENSLIWPAEGSFTSGYGRRWGRNHNGIDIAAKPGTPIYAPAMGLVTFSDTKSGYGNYIMIDHGDGYVTTYAHLTTSYVKEGDSVKEGDVIGTIGSTGRVTGPHLHFEILHNGNYVDPMRYIAG